MSVSPRRVRLRTLNVHSLVSVSTYMRERRGFVQGIIIKFLFPVTRPLACLVMATEKVLIDVAVPRAHWIKKYVLIQFSLELTSTPLRKVAPHNVAHSKQAK